MTWEHLAPTWRPANVDSSELWARCGAQWLTAPGVAVPNRLVRSVVGVTRHLDRFGAGIADHFGAAGLGVLTERAAHLELGAGGRITCGGAGRLVRCRDGWLAVSMPRPDDVDMVPAWLEIDSVPNDPWPAMEREVANRPGDEVADRAALLGLACSFVGETTDHRAVLVRDLGDASPRPLEGMIVANLASLWAGPLAADILSRLGARVIKVESTGRPDGSREAPTFFHAMHERSESVAIDLAAATGHRQLRAFLERVDVVIEGSRPRALERMGIVAEQIAQSGPTVWLSITGHGRTGDSGMRVGFGDDGAAAGGLVGWVDREPRFLADAIADPLTGLIAATAVQQLTQRGGRWLVDVALSRVAASMVGTVAAGTSKQKLPSHPPNAPRRRHEGGGPTPLGRDTQALFTEFDVPH